MKIEKIYNEVNRKVSITHKFSFITLKFLSLYYDMATHVSSGQPVCSSSELALRC